MCTHNCNQMSCFFLYLVTVITTYSILRTLIETKVGKNRQKKAKGTEGQM